MAYSVVMSHRIIVLLEADSVSNLKKHHHLFQDGPQIQGKLA